MCALTARHSFRRCLLKRILLVLTSTAVMVLGFASAALAQAAAAAQYQYGGNLPPTGGPVSLLPILVVLGAVLFLGGLALIINLTRDDLS